MAKRKPKIKNTTDKRHRMLTRKGKVMSLALNFDQHGPQGSKSKYPAPGRPRLAAWV